MRYLRIRNAGKRPRYRDWLMFDRVSLLVNGPRAAQGVTLSLWGDGPNPDDRSGCVTVDLSRDEAARVCSILCAHLGYEQPNPRTCLQCKGAGEVLAGGPAGMGGNPFKACPSCGGFAPR